MLGRARVGRDAKVKRWRDAAAEFQSTRPRGARLEIIPDNASRHIVSIHAPAWGATCGLLSGRNGQPVSIHAPAWGATKDMAGGCRVRCMFQSTRPRGARPLKRALLIISSSVSIHAPAWGATTVRKSTRRLTACFNPRARVGRDAKVKRWRDAAAEFQSTRPRGARLEIIPDNASRHIVSIHAPAWGATCGLLSGRNGQPVSIHAPAWGATAQKEPEAMPDMFQSTRPRGARPFSAVYGGYPLAVSIHAPAWGATVHLLFPIILHKYASLFEDVSHVCPHFRFMSVME